MDEIELEADCARCAALCCVAPAFDRSDEFGVDKPALEPCPHLTASNACAIHADRARKGFSGCISFDCYGAGQTVVESLFDGANWREEPEILQPMAEAFERLRRIHYWLFLLKTAGRWPLDTVDLSLRDRLAGLLSPEGGWTRARLKEVDLAAAETAMNAFLERLKVYRNSPRLTARD